MSETSPYLGGTRVLAGSAEPDHYFGPYRGIVTNTTDPANQGRIKAIVPQIFGNSSTEIDWALPMILPGLLSLPTPGQGVWIQFEGGDINYPVWTGMWQAEPSVAPYEVAGAGASAVAQSEAYARSLIVPTTLPMGAMYGAVGTNVPNGGAVTQINLVQDFVQGGVVVSGNAIVIPTSGYYLVSAQIEWASAPTSSYYVTKVLNVTQGNAVISQGFGGVASGNLYQGPNAAKIVYLNAGDNITLNAQQNSATNPVTTGAGRDVTWLHIVQVGIAGVQGPAGPSAPLQTLAGTLAVDYTTTGSNTTFLTTASLAIGTWLVTFSGTVFWGTGSAASDVTAINLAAGTAAASFSGPVAGEARNDVQAANNVWTNCITFQTLVTVSSPGTLVFMAQAPGTQKPVIKALTPSTSSGPATGWTAVKTS